MLDIREVLFEENVNLNLNARTKEEVFAQMTRMLYENGVIAEEQPFIDELVHREAEGVTGIGEGIAIPHGRRRGGQPQRHRHRPHFSRRQLGNV